MKPYIPNSVVRPSAQSSWLGDEVKACALQRGRWDVVVMGSEWPPAKPRMGMQSILCPHNNPFPLHTRLACP